MNSTQATPEFANKNAALETVRECPACSHTKGFEVRMARVFECGACHAIYGDLYLGDSYGFVLPQFAPAPKSAAENDAQVARQRYFDFDCVSSKGLVRRHGWFDPMTKLLTQVG